MKTLLERLVGLKLDITLKNGDDICGTELVAVIGKVLITRQKGEIFLINIKSIAFVSIRTHHPHGDVLIENITKIEQGD